MNDGRVTRVLEALHRGEPIATEQLLPLVYDELRRLAGQQMAREAAGHTLQPTALVHEAYVRLVGDQVRDAWDSRAHFFVAAAEAMRRILIEYARRKKASKRGGDMQRRELREEDAVLVPDDSGTLLALDEALTRLTAVDAGLAQLVQLRYFTGLTIEETAKVMNISPRTAKRDWAYARAWLRREMEAGG